jgi:hypothetical protein
MLRIQRYDVQPPSIACFSSNRFVVINHQYGRSCTCVPHLDSKNRHAGPNTGTARLGEAELAGFGSSHYFERVRGRRHARFYGDYGKNGQGFRLGDHKSLPSCSPTRVSSVKSFSIVESLLEGDIDCV